MNATPQSTTISPFSVPFLAVPRKRGDEACAALSPNAFKVWYRIARMTWGWQRTEAAITYEELKRACGIKASTTISAALKELVSKGFITIFKHTGPRGRRLASSYALLGTLEEKKARLTRPLQPTQPGRNWSPPRQERRNTPPALVRPPYDPGDFPPLGVAFSSVMIPDPFEASEQTRASNIHAQLDQIELPCFQENQGEVVKVVEVVEVYEEEAQETPTKAAEEKDKPSPLEELQRRLAELIEQSNDMYCLMASSVYGTMAYEERKRQLRKIREEQLRVRALIHRLEAV